MAAGPVKTGRNVAVEIGKETTFGTIASSFDANAFLVETAKAENNQEFYESKAKVGSRELKGLTVMAKSAKLNLEGEIYPELIPYLVNGVLGAETKTADGTGYKHSFAFADVLPSHSFKIAYDDVDSIGYLGGVVDILNFNLAAKAEARFSAELACKQEDDSVSAGTPTITAKKPFMCQGGAIQVAAVGGSLADFLDLKNISFAIKNNLVKDDYRQNGSLYVVSLPVGALDISGSMTVLCNANGIVLRQAFASNTHFKLTYTLSSTETYDTGKYYKIVITIPDFVFLNGPIDIPDEGMKINLDFRAVKPATGSIITVDCHDSRSTVY